MTETAIKKKPARKAAKKKETQTTTNVATKPVEKKQRHYDECPLGWQEGHKGKLWHDSGEEAHFKCQVCGHYWWVKKKDIK